MTKSPNENDRFSHNSSAVEESQVKRSSVDNKSAKTLDCDDSKGYSLEEGTVPELAR